MPKPFNILSEVNTNTKEGKVLCAAIGKLRTLPEFEDKNPDEILQEVCKAAYPPDGEVPGEEPASHKEEVIEKVVEKKETPRSTASTKANNKAGGDKKK